jgi:hypothetical protein
VFVSPNAARTLTVHRAYQQMRGNYMFLELRNRLALAMSSMNERRALLARVDSSHHDEVCGEGFLLFFLP